jgi:hypothetical protein
MGSQQSTSISPPHPKNIEDTKANPNADVDSDTTITYEATTNRKKKKSPPPHLKGFQLVEYTCRKKKRNYDLCHNTKHKTFVVGKKFEDEQGDERDCEDLFEIYKECIYKGMLKDREKRGLKAPTEESALGGYKEYADDE